MKVEMVQRRLAKTLSRHVALVDLVLCPSAKENWTWQKWGLIFLCYDNNHFTWLCGCTVYALESCAERVTTGTRICGASAGTRRVIRAGAGWARDRKFFVRVAKCWLNGSETDM